MSSRGLPVTKARRQTLRDEANERTVVWASLGPAKQLDALDRRLGKEKGAKKQRLRLVAMLAAKLVKGRP